MKFRLSLIRSRLAQEKEEAFDNFMKCTMVKNNWLSRQNDYLLPINTELDSAILGAIQEKKPNTFAAEPCFQHYRVFLCFFGHIPKNQDYFDYYNANDMKKYIREKVHCGVTDHRLHHMVLQDAAKELRRVKIEFKFKLNEELVSFGIDEVTKRFLLNEMDDQQLKSLYLPEKKKTTENLKSPISTTKIFNQKKDIEYSIIVTLPEEPINQEVVPSKFKEDETKKHLQAEFDDCDLDENKIDEKKINFGEVLSKNQFSNKRVERQKNYQKMLSSIDVQYKNSNTVIDYPELTIDVGKIEWKDSDKMY